MKVGDKVRSKSMPQLGAGCVLYIEPVSVQPDDKLRIVTVGWQSFMDDWDLGDLIKVDDL